MLKLTRKIAETKMSEVWDGYIDGIRVAVKKPVEQVDMLKILRFVREAKYWKEISDIGMDGVARVIQIDEDEPWFAVEFIDGKTLDEALRNADIREIMFRMLEVIRILEVVHKSGYYHFDLKPTNIIIDNFGDVEIIDWGLAARVFRKMKDEKYTFIGTPSYAPPELWDPEAYGKPDETSDVYEIGATFYRVIAKQVPFSKKSEVLAGKVRPFPTVVPKGVKRIILKAINPDRGQRYSNMREMYNDVLAWLQKEKILWRGVYKIRFKDTLNITMSKGISFVADTSSDKKKLSVKIGKSTNPKNLIAVIKGGKIKAYRDNVFVDYGFKRKLKAGASARVYHGTTLYYKKEKLGRLDFGLRNVIYVDFDGQTPGVGRKYFEFLTYLNEHSIPYGFKRGKERLNIIAHKVMIKNESPDSVVEAIVKIENLRIHLRLVPETLPDRDMVVVDHDVEPAKLYKEIVGCKR